MKRQLRLMIFSAAMALLVSPVTRADTTALDYSYFEYFLTQAYGKKSDDFAVSKEQLLANLRLIKDGHPTIAGVQS